MGNIEVTTVDNLNTGEYFTASDLAFGVTYARRFTDKFTFGATVKALQERIWDMGATDVAFDFGVHYNTGFRNLRLAMAINNFGPDTRFSGKELQFDYDPSDWTWPWNRTPLAGELLTEDFPLPVVFRFGLAYDILDNHGATSKPRLTAAADLVHNNDVNEKVDVGLEFAALDFTLRGGYIINTDQSYASDLGEATGLSAGVGITVHPFGKAQFGVDYAYRDLGRLGMSHLLNLNVRF